MAARLTDKQKKKIVADYLELGSYNAVAKRNHVCGETARRVVEYLKISQRNLDKKRKKIQPISWPTWKVAGKQYAILLR